MTGGALTADAARSELYAAMDRDVEFEEKAETALSIGERYLDVDNGHLARIDRESEYWQAVVSSDDADGEYPPGALYDLGVTFCRHTLSSNEPVRFHDAVVDGWDDDVAFETHDLHCYHGTTIVVGGEVYGTVCFVASEARAEPFSTEETMFAELLTRLLEHELQADRMRVELRRLEAFADVLSHDLRNPLNVAQGYLEAAREANEREELRIVADELSRIEAIISNVLLLARQGQDVVATEEVSLASVVPMCWQSVDTADAELVVADELIFAADPNRLRALFENMFRNAVEHGGEDVTVRVGALPERDGFYVADDGRGIPEESREAVFETGFSTGTDGLGLGMAIVEGIVAAHDWRIDVTESTDGGARFDVAGVMRRESN